MMINAVLLVVLAYESFYDIKSQRIRLLPLVVSGLAGVLMRLIYENITWEQLFISALPGGVMLFAGWITRQNIGYGDGMVILALGLCRGWSMAVCTLWIALTLAGMLGIILVFLKKRGRKERIPLCPYILLGMIISMIMGVG